MSLTLHQEILIGIMRKLTPSQQSSVVSFAKRLAKVSRFKSSETVKDSREQVTTTTPKRKEGNKGENTSVIVLDGRTPLATRLANEPPSPVKWIPGCSSGTPATKRIMQLVDAKPHEDQVAHECPTCKRTVGAIGLARHLEMEHNSVMC